MASALGLVALTACTRDDEVSPSSGSDPASSDGGGAPAPSPDPSVAIATTSVPWGRATVTVGVRPLVRRGDHLVLTLDVRAEDPEGDVTEDLVNHLGHVWGASRGGPWRGIRLLDLAGDTVAGPAYDADGRTVVNTTDTARHDSSILLDGGVPRVLELVYPRDIGGIAPGGTLTLQHGRNSFRLTDIPITG